MTIYEKHIENLHLLEDTIEQIQRDLTFYIKSDENNLKKDNQKVYSYTKLRSFLVVAWIEVRLLKLIYEPPKSFTTKDGIKNEPEVFNEHEKNEIIALDSLEHKWLKVVEIAICNAYKINRALINNELNNIEKKEIEIPRYFTENEKKEVLANNDLTDMWLKIYEITIKQDYLMSQEMKRKILKKILKSDKSKEITELKESKIRELIADKLDFTPRLMFLELQNLISKDLADAFTIRNKIAHGQWKHAFENDIRKESKLLTPKIRTENIVILQQKMNLFKILSDLIEMLCRTPKIFKERFDNYHKKIKNIKSNNSNRDYNDYKQYEIKKYKKGKLKQKINFVIKYFESNGNQQNVLVLLHKIYKMEIIDISELLKIIEDEFNITELEDAKNQIIILINK